MKLPLYSMFVRFPAFASAFLIMLIIISCARGREDYVIAPAEHKEEVNEWHADRIDRLQGPEGWLRLAGLFTLDEERRYTFGSARANDIVFPEGSIAPLAGFFERNGDTVSIHLNEDIDITHDGAPLTSTVIFTPGESLLLEKGRLAFTVIQREELLAIRLYDEDSRYMKNFDGIERFPVDHDWRVVADFIAHDEPVEVPITNILGQTYPVTSPGILRFEKEGKTWELLALEATDSFFINFGDATNGQQTYAAGRFLYTDEPDRNNRVVIDFNKAYNAPCVFTPYSTCPLPPRENRIGLSITAGEKMYTMPE